MYLIGLRICCCK